MAVVDSLRNNLDKVSMNTYLNTDKIVQTFTGSYNYTTDTITRDYTYAGFPNPQQVFRITHGFTRPLFIELLWSLDNSLFWLGTAANDSNGEFAVAYSDSTYIYIMTSALAANTRVYYKVVCSWMDEYDTTNPDVSAFDNFPAAYTQTFNSRNIMPSIIAQGSISASTSSAVLTDVVTTVAHNASYAPEFKVFFEAFSGEVWPLNSGGSRNPYLVDDDQVEGQVFTDPTNLYIDLSMKSVNGTRKAWYFLYGKKGDTIIATYGSGVFVI